MTLGSAPLPTIAALARAGAVEHAWRSFVSAGYDRDDEPAALTVKGRLLKDLARAARGEERRRLYGEAAAAYGRSAALRPATYPLINAATLTLLAGEAERAAEIACEVLERIEREPDEPETPYWRGATRAEALLLAGRGEGAKAALREALAEAPRAWEDHGSTLRQFLLIHDALGGERGWLEMLRPPRSLHYSGRIGLSDDAVATAAAAAAELIEREQVGFGFGALAAGSDIIVAEALVEAGAELHVILPSDPESFARRSVEPYGAGWRERFDALLAEAESLYPVRPLLSEPDAPAIALADRIASGIGRLNAERLLGEARELVVGSIRPGRRAPEHRIEVPDEAQRAPSVDGPTRHPPALALVSIDLGPAEAEAYDERAALVRDLLADLPTDVAPFVGSDRIVAGFADASAAAAASRAIRRRAGAGVRVAGHYGFVPLARDPFLERLRPARSGTAILDAVAQAAPPDAICVSLDFAAALAADEQGPSGAHWIGELSANDGGGPIPLYALTEKGSDD